MSERLSIALAPVKVGNISAELLYKICQNCSYNAKDIAKKDITIYLNQYDIFI